MAKKNRETEPKASKEREAVEETPDTVFVPTDGMENQSADLSKEQDPPARDSQCTGAAQTGSSALERRKFGKFRGVKK